MPVTPTYPGIYIEELPSSTHTITAAPTNIAVFIGYTQPLKTNPANWGKAVQIFGFTDYERQFGGFLRSAAFTNSASSFGDMAKAVNQFFLNGGSVAYVVGIQSQTLENLANFPATVQIGSLTFTAREITDEIYQMTITIRPILTGASPPGEEIADIIITYGPQSGPGTITETYRRVSMDPNSSDYIESRIGTLSNPISSLVTVSVGSPPGFFPAMTQMETFPIALPENTQIFNASDFTNVMQQDTDLDKLPIFNLMIIPGVGVEADPLTGQVTGTLVMSTALAFCERKRAFLIMDPPINDSADGTVPNYPALIQNTISDPGMAKGTNGALYFPYLKSVDPLTGSSNDPVTGLQVELPPSATVAGIFAATDLSRGVWKAPAGFQATTTNTTGVVDRGRMTDQRQGVLNPLGVNCLRDFPNVGTAVFGARTLVTVTDEQWRYVPVRRMALFLEQTLYANLGWVVFEPNDEPLWTAIRTSIESFMLGLFRQGAFQGTTPSQAFQVKCDSQTTTQDDINNGIVNIVVAFAPLKPAEFVIIKISQLAGQTQTA
jgi:hypothetical protein